MIQGEACVCARERERGGGGGETLGNNRPLSQHLYIGSLAKSLPVAAVVEVVVALKSVACFMADAIPQSATQSDSQ
jgi:hypothetical protein